MHQIKKIRSEIVKIQMDEKTAVIKIKIPWELRNFMGLS